MGQLDKDGVTGSFEVGLYIGARGEAGRLAWRGKGVEMLGPPIRWGSPRPVRAPVYVLRAAFAAEGSFAAEGRGGHVLKERACAVVWLG